MNSSWDFSFCLTLEQRSSVNAGVAVQGFWEGWDAGEFERLSSEMSVPAREKRVRWMLGLLFRRTTEKIDI